MFQHIRYRLLASYLAVFTVILSVFAIAVRVTFLRSLTEELTDKLETLAQAAATDLETDGQTFKVEDEEALTTTNQALQWFDPQGNLIAQQGTYVTTLPFDPQRTVQTQPRPYAIQVVTMPIKNRDTGVLLGYVRASESMDDLQHALHRLDWGVGSGILLALGLSALGGVWLTRQAMQPIEQSFHTLQRFTADASHELRSPLMAIKSNAAVALKYAEGMRALDVEKFQAIASATAQMSALTEDLLLLARVDHTTPQPHDRVNITTLLTELVQLYRPEAVEKHIQLKTQIEPELPVLGNRVQLIRLFTNLIDNALRYTPEHGTVEIHASRAGHTLVITVQDTGIGIDPTQIDHIFDRFWQADRSRAYWSGGFGLGLAIAQGIAQRHSGKITVSSQPDVGTVFRVSLPAHSIR